MKYLRMFFRLSFFCLILFVIVGSFSNKPTFAQIPTANTSSNTNPSDGADFTTDPALEDISEASPNISIKFYDLSPGTYWLCTGDQFCIVGDANAPATIPTQILDDDEMVNVGSNLDSEGNLTIKVCGNGDKKLKTNCPGDNWFHGGNIYYFSVGTKKNNDIYRPLKRGAFYVPRTYPNVTISPDSNLTEKTNKLHISLSGGIRPGGSGRNNYYISLQGADYTQKHCVVSGDQGADFTGISQLGKYTILINDQIEHRDKHSEDYLTGGVCAPGFTYYKITCDFTKTGGSCSDPQKGKDPKGEEYKSYLAGLAEISKVGLGTSFPCGDGKLASAKNLGSCGSIDTAIGSISVSPQGFIESIFRFVLFFASFGGIFLIIFSGYKIMISRGDKEALSGARETITAAIVGLLFIVLSIVILEIIGVQVLRIPGFAP